MADSLTEQYLSTSPLGLKMLSKGAWQDEDFVWTAGTQGRYGKVYVPWMKKDEYVHRAAYRIYHGRIDPGMTVDHVHEAGCRSRLCFRFEHLEQITQEENNLRRVRATHCPHGHEFIESNIYWIKTQKNGKPYTARRCRTCVLSSMALHYKKRTAPHVPKD